jgi:hypothetical protein
MTVLKGHKKHRNNHAKSGSQAGRSCASLPPGSIIVSDLFCTGDKGRGIGLLVEGVGMNVLGISNPLSCDHYLLASFPCMSLTQSSCKAFVPKCIRRRRGLQYGHCVMKKQSIHIQSTSIPHIIGTPTPTLIITMTMTIPETCAQFHV